MDRPWPNSPPHWQQPTNGMATEVRYLRRDIDEQKTITRDHERRLQQLEGRKLTDLIDLKMVAVIILLLLGLTGNLTLDELKRLAL